MMQMRSFIIFSVLIAAVFISSCSSLSSKISPGINLADYHDYYVVRHDRDMRHIDKFIKNEMQKLGLNAQSGPIDSKPPEVDVIVNYIDKWHWDITVYMLRLTIDFRDAKSDVLLATGKSEHPSFGRKPPEFHAREILESIFKEKK
ncbi:MAG: hypothetical protein IMF02_10865 [Proteobacteria bacterium]|nr:hypothetical protein [Pseudomonadota bacterium]